MQGIRARLSSPTMPGIPVHPHSIEHSNQSTEAQVGKHNIRCARGASSIQTKAQKRTRRRRPSLVRTRSIEHSYQTTESQERKIQHSVQQKHTRGKWKRTAHGQVGAAGDELQELALLLAVE